MPIPRTYRCGEAIKGACVLRVAATRYLPRGVAKKDLPKYFDAWLPVVAPSAKLIKEYKQKPAGIASFKWFGRRYGQELAKSIDARRAIELLARVAERLELFIGCVCEDESLCHRLILREEITKLMQRKG